MRSAAIPFVVSLSNHLFGSSQSSVTGQQKQESPPIGGLSCFCVLLCLTDFDFGFHALDGFVQFLKVKEVGASAAVIEHVSLFANEI